MYLCLDNFTATYIILYFPISVENILGGKRASAKRTAKEKLTRTHIFWTNSRSRNKAKSYRSKKHTGCFLFQHSLHVC